jgi:tRNA(Ser,Leu) C12 N-acetylase TAN1
MAKRKKSVRRKKATAKRAVSKKAKAKKTRKAVRKSKKKKSVKKTSKKAAKAPKQTVSSGKFNLIVTYDPTHAGTAENELNAVLKKIGEKPKIITSEAEGLFKVAVSDARKVVGRLRDLCRADPNLFVVTYHYIPIDSWCKSDTGVMQKSIKPLALGIGENERWKMNISKRHWDKLSGTELIIKLTDVIDREKVDLNKPQKIVQVEIIGKEAGISLLQPEDLLNIAEVKEEA